MSRKKALITGITGQDGMVLSQILLEKGYQVFGLRPYSSQENVSDLLTNQKDITLYNGDLSDTSNLVRILDQTTPDEVYNLGAMTHVQVSFDMPEHTGNINGLGVTRLLEALRILGAQKTTKFYQASSSEMFGNALAPQNENTSFAPCSPYGAAKLYAYWMVKTYRDGYGFHASNGILFNHESGWRGTEFVTRKITRAIGEFQMGRKTPLLLGNIDSKRDWGHAKDYMMGAWMMMQQKTPDDYVLASGITKTVRDFANAAFLYAGYTLVWDGVGLDEVARNKKTGQILIKIDEALFRPIDVNHLQGDASKARDVLGWVPSIDFDSLVAEMVRDDSPAAQAKRIYG